ncbi:RNA polymerase sigma factor [bacterium]|nr:RNA polymerase sigma factor [bacterium]
MIFREKKRIKTDIALVKAISKGDEAAFRELLNQFQHKIRSYAFRFLGDAEEAKDIAQETFLKFYRSIDNYKDSGSINSYLYAIARNLCIDYSRKKKPEVSKDFQGPIIHETPFDSLDSKENLSFIMSAIRDLPENQCSAVLLKYSEGLSCAEIAEVLSISKSAVESLLVRGRQTLKKRLLTDIEN